MKEKYIMTLIYIINGKAGFYENPNDKTGGIEFYKQLVKKIRLRARYHPRQH